MGDPEPTGTNGVYLDQPQSTLQGSLFEAFSTHNNGALANASPEQMLADQPAHLQGQQNYSNDIQFGFIDRLAILLNSECQSHFSKQYRVMEDRNSSFSIPNTEQNNQRLGDNLTYFSNSTSINTTETIRDANSALLNSSYINSQSDSSNMAVEDILFHVANVLFILSYLAPPTRYGQVLLHSGLCIGFLIFATWAWNIVCAPDVFVWYFAFLIFNAGQLLYILYQMRPIKFDEDIETIYTNLFQPMTVTRAQFKKLLGRAALTSGHVVDTNIPSTTNSAQLVNIHTGECYAIQNMTKTDRLALLVSGRVNVLNDRAFLHHILPGEFLDSPEFESSGLNVGQHGAVGASVEESTFKVTVCAAVPSRCIVWQRNTLEVLLLKDVHLATVMTTVISRDITNKLYSMNAKLKPESKDGKDRGHLDIRLPGIAGRLSQMDARQLEQFVTKETEKRQKDVPSENSDNTKNKLSLPSTFKRKYTQMKKMTTKNQGSELDITQNEARNESKGNIYSGSASHNEKSQRDNIGLMHIKEKASNSANLRPPPLQPAGFLRKLSFRDRRGSTPSPFLNSSVETIIPISTKYLKVPSPHPSPTITSKLG